MVVIDTHLARGAANPERWTGTLRLGPDSGYGECVPPPPRPSWSGSSQRPRMGESLLRGDTPETGASKCSAAMRWSLSGSPSSVNKGRRRARPSASSGTFASSDPSSHYPLGQSAAGGGSVSGNLSA